MLKLSRSKEILQLVNAQGTVTVRELTETFNVTDVTIRRDLQELEEQGLLLRTHGGAVKVAAQPAAVKPVAAEPNGDTPGGVTDALIIAPVQNRIAHTLRERAMREHIPLLAESVAFEGAIYLGPDNYHAAFELGQWTGDTIKRAGIPPNVLDLTAELENSVLRSSGFIDGLRSIVGDALHVVSVHGQYIYSAAYHVAFDALRVHRDITILFGINDDLILAAIQAAQDVGRDRTASSPSTSAARAGRSSTSSTGAGRSRRAWRCSRKSSAAKASTRRCGCGAAIPASPRSSPRRRC